MPRIAIGGISHETHTFVPRPTGLEGFTGQNYHEGDDLVRQMGSTPSVLGGALEGLAMAHCQPVPLLYASAMPSGTVTAQAYDTLTSALLQRLRAETPVAGVLLALHGAMVAENQDDCEGAILQQVRAIVGPACPIVCVLDMHGKMSPAMVANADVLVGYHGNPHLDMYERGKEAASLIDRLVDGRLKPAHAMIRPPLLLNALTTWTEKPPLRPAWDEAARWAGDARIANITIMGGFAYADTPFSGTSVVVTTNGDQRLADKLARRLAAILWASREAATYQGVAVSEAVTRALAAAHAPVVLADVGDNVGGGTPGDGTILLKALLEAGAQDAVVTLADPEAVSRASAAGAGAIVEMSIGGKVDSFHGEPLLLSVEVERLTDGRYSVGATDHFASVYGRNVSMGPCAVVRCRGVRILLTGRKTPPGDLAQLRSQGITPEAQRVIVAKSAVAFRGAYAPIAGEIIEVNTPGLCSTDISHFAYKKLSRPIFPLDNDATYV